MSILRIENLSLYRQKNLLLKSFSANFEAGKIYSLIANNGAGKTTLLKTIAGLLEVPEKTIFIDEQDLCFLSLKERSQRISLLLQHSPFEPFTTAFNRIAHGLIPSQGLAFNPKLFAQKSIIDMLRLFNIEHLVDRPLMHMSGGEQRLVYLAKCLINRQTKIILLDEPTTYLDFSQKNNLAILLKNLAFCGALIIFSSHDQSFINNIASCSIIIEQKMATLNLLNPAGYQHEESGLHFLKRENSLAL